MADNRAFLRVDMDEVLRLLPAHLTNVARTQLPFATALALTTVGQESKKLATQAIPQVFDRPTPFTRNSVFHKAANKREKPIAAQVWIKDMVGKGTPAAKYLLPQIYGLSRGHKRMERLLSAAKILPPGRYITPGRYAELDQYGNLKGSFITRIVSGLGAQTDQYQNTTARSYKRQQRAKRRFGGYTYFTNQPGRRGQARAVYERTQFAFGTALRPVLAFVRKRPSYRVRFPFVSIVQQNLPQRFGAAFGPALERALATSNTRSAKRFESMPRSR